MLAVLGGTFEAGWLLGMGAGLFGVEALPVACRWPFAGGFRSAFGLILCVILCASVVALVLRAVARLFLVLLAGAFAVLALLAIRNINLFGLVAGFVLTGSLGGVGTGAARKRRGRLAEALACRGLGGAGLADWGHGFLARCGGVRSLLSRHWRGAAIRSGREPACLRARCGSIRGTARLAGAGVVSTLRQAGVYLFHNGPG